MDNKKLVLTSGGSIKKGKNISQISRELGIDRKTVRKILSRLKDGEVKVPEFSDTVY